MCARSRLSLTDFFAIAVISMARTCWRHVHFTIQWDILIDYISNCKMLIVNQFETNYTRSAMRARARAHWFNFCHSSHTKYCNVIQYRMQKIFAYGPCTSICGCDEMYVVRKSFVFVSMRATRQTEQHQRTESGATWIETFDGGSSIQWALNFDRQRKVFLFTLWSNLDFILNLLYIFISSAFFSFSSCVLWRNRHPHTHTQHTWASLPATKRFSFLFHSKCNWYLSLTFDSFYSAATPARRLLSPFTQFALLILLLLIFPSNRSNIVEHECFHLMWKYLILGTVETNTKASLSVCITCYMVRCKESIPIDANQSLAPLLALSLGYRCHPNCNWGHVLLFLPRIRICVCVRMHEQICWQRRKHPFSLLVFQLSVCVCITQLRG